ncbi:DNA translocase FtsK [Rhizobium giardinii]|uniref:DNA translocase FtsK n=1 Tax=Rhizobium giardinii TaxID=56731 RepID=UPI003D6FCFED
MRLSRTNFSNPFDHTGEQPAGQENLAKTEHQRRVYGSQVDPNSAENKPGTDTDAMAASEIEGRVDAPVWQSAFVLRPNVRFTRTPESVYSKRPTAETKKQPAPADGDVGVETSSAEDAAPAVVANPAACEPTVAEVRIEQEAMGIQLLSLRLKREVEMCADVSPVCVATEPAAIDPVDLACFPTDEDQHAAESSGIILKGPHALYDVSDEVFWSALDTAADMDALIPTARWQPPAFNAAPDSVTALYREIGFRSTGAPSARLVVPGPLAKAPVPLLPEVLVDVKPVRPVPPNPVEPVLDIAPPAAPSTPASQVKSEILVKAASASTGFGMGEYVFPPVTLLQEPAVQETAIITPEALEQSAGLLESVLEDFGIRGEIIDVRPGPVVTLYEFEPAPGVKSSRVIGLSDDIARSMSALSARVAVVPGRNVIGIELPNPVRETVYFRELIESENYGETRFKLALCLGKTIGGEPVVAELAKMPHLLVAGTTGSGKSVAINTMILSLLYRLKPEECRLIMVDPKMLELSVYDGIPHLLTPVVTDPKKAVMALKWAVREMEDRYRKMSRLGVRNIDGFNARAASARAKGETILCSVQTGFDRSTGEAIFEQEEMDLSPMPYIVVIVDEMADLMMVAGKEIEGAIQRLAQMARAAGIHLIMATQRPSVDVITGTIKANFPTRISFQVTSKIDSRTILGEQGAEHLLGQGDMLHMVGGGRIARVHGPFVSDEEVEKVVAHLKTQGRPEYLGTVTEDAEEAEEAVEEDGAVFDKGALAEEDGNDLYDKAVKVVLRDKKCSTSYIQRRLQIGYNRAASLVERMEREGLVGPANHVGKRAILSAVREQIEVSACDED